MSIGDPYCPVHGQFPCNCASKQQLAYGSTSFTPVENTFTVLPTVSLSDLVNMTTMLDVAAIKYSTHPIPADRKHGDSDTVPYSERRSTKAVTALRIQVGQYAPGYARFYTLFVYDKDGKLLGHEAWE